MARRGENIYKRKDGRWEGRYGKELRPDGKRAFGYVYAPKYCECKEKLRQAKAKYMEEQQINGVATFKKCGGGTVSDFLKFWLHGIVKPHIKVSTYSNYYNIVEKWLIPAFGKMALNEVGKEEIQCFINALPGHGLSPGTVRNIYSVLHAALSKAKEYGYLSVNASEGIRLPKMEQKRPRALTLWEQKTLEKTAKEDKFGFAVLLASYTGMRIGEICGLTWKDVDLENGVIHVSKTVRRIQCHDPGAPAKTAVVVGSAKSDRSERYIPLPERIAVLLREQREAATGEYVLSLRGKPLEPRILQYRFKVLLKKAGLADINFHALRHTFATRCLELMFDIKTLSEILGHASAKMTLDLYAHSQIAQKRQAMGTLDQLFDQTA